jgi:hypothetical protein
MNKYDKFLYDINNIFTGNSTESLLFCSEEYIWPFYVFNWE